MMMAESIQLGVYLNKGVSANNTTITTSDMIMLARAVCTPAAKFTADLEKDPVPCSPQTLAQETA
jgi:hypothetical protein